MEALRDEAHGKGAPGEDLPNSGDRKTLPRVNQGSTMTSAWRIVATC